MDRDGLIVELKTKFHAVDEDGLHQGKTEAGVTVWGIGVFELIDGVVKKRNLTFYTEGESAYWGNSEPNPDTQIQDPTFIDRVNTFIASKITDGTIKFGYIAEMLEVTQKAMVAAIMPDNSTKNVIVSEDESGTFTIDIV